MTRLSGLASGRPHGFLMDVLVVLSVVAVAAAADALKNGLRAQAFRGLATVQEIVCSAVTLDPGEDLSTMALYTVLDRHVLATVIPWKHECTTSSSFAACVIVKGDSHKTTLHTLVLDLHEEESRLYGCNVTAVRTPCGDERRLVDTTSQRKE
ncbi:uncharacterized protein LOC112568587 [Pomacea canaliculata]|uniref:uncharacterized protein LOC112568587 n=1 Tax=Pomacea canaliculata TaxID=400727 RepID=UPI000D72F972|nr:uncharacterized protein LOC112568587 [Pomacea canaliculata]